MDFDFTTETITPDSTSILTIGGTGALELPSGTTAQEPVTAIAGAIRWNTSSTWVEYYSGSAWAPFTTPTSSVTSFQTSLSGLTPSTATTGAVTLAGTLGTASGGTGITTAPTAGQVLYSAATTYAPTTLSTLAVTALSGTAGNITVSAATGASTINLATAGTAGTYGQVTTDTFGRVTSGTVIADVAHGGTGVATLTANGLVYGNGTSAVGSVAVGTTGQVLVGNTAAAPTWSTLTGIAVTTFSAGTTGFTPSTATSGAITLAGTLVPANGGTGATATPTNGQLLVGNGTNYTVATVGTGTGISTTVGAGTLTINNTGVTSNLAGTGITVSSATGAVTIGTANIPNSSLTNSSITIGSTSISLGATSTTLSGLTQVTLTGATSNLTGVGTPVNGSDAVPLSYLQSFQAGLEWKVEVAAASTANIPATYANGTAGVGATLTTTGALTTVDGYTLVVNDRILIKNQTTALQNGIYSVTSIGGTTVLTRTIDANTSASLNNATTLVTNGTANSNTGWTQTTANPTMGTSSIVWVQFSGNGAGVSSFQTSLSGLTPSTATTGAVTLAGTLGVGSGGTGATATPTNGQVLVGNGTNFTVATLASGTGISTTTGAGTLQINNTGVTSAVGTAGNITVSAATGAVTFNLATAGTAGTYGAVTTDAFGRVTVGTVINPVANGGTGLATVTTNGIPYGNGTSALGVTAAGTAGQVFTGSATVPGWTTLSTIAVTSVTGTANQITASASTGAVTLSTPATFIAPGSIASTSTITAATGLTVTAGGALVTAGGVTVSTLTANSFLYSGTAGLLTTTAAPTNGQLLIGSTGAAPVAATLAVSGTSIYVTNGAGTITLAGPKFFSEFTTAPTVAPTATASQAVAIGSGAAASIFGTLATANGDFATAGDAQHVNAVLRAITTTNATAELFLDGSGASQRLVLPINSAWTFTIKVVARRTDVVGSLGSWIFNGFIYKDATAASTAIVGVSKTTIARVGGIAPGNDPTVTADTTNGSLKVTGTGVTGDTIRWVATVDFAQVTN